MELRTAGVRKKLADHSVEAKLQVARRSELLALRPVRIARNVPVDMLGTPEHSLNFQLEEGNIRVVHAAPDNSVDQDSLEAWDVVSDSSIASVCYPNRPAAAAAGIAVAGSLAVGFAAVAAAAGNGIAAVAVSRIPHSIFVGSENVRRSFYFAFHSDDIVQSLRQSVLDHGYVADPPHLAQYYFSYFRQ